MKNRDNRGAQALRLKLGEHGAQRAMARRLGIPENRLARAARGAKPELETALALQDNEDIPAAWWLEPPAPIKETPRYRSGAGLGEMAL